MSTVINNRLVLPDIKINTRQEPNPDLKQDQKIRSLYDDPPIKILTLMKRYFKNPPCLNYFDYGDSFALKDLGELVVQHVNNDSKYVTSHVESYRCKRIISLGKITPSNNYGKICFDNKVNPTIAVQALNSGGIFEISLLNTLTIARVNVSFLSKKVRTYAHCKDVKYFAIGSRKYIAAAFCRNHKEGFGGIIIFNIEIKLSTEDTSKPLIKVGVHSIICGLSSTQKWSDVSCIKIYQPKDGPVGGKTLLLTTCVHQRLIMLLDLTHVEEESVHLDGWHYLDSSYLNPELKCQEDRKNLYLEQSNTREHVYPLDIQIAKYLIFISDGVFGLRVLKICEKINDKDNHKAIIIQEVGMYTDTDKIICSEHSTVSQVICSALDINLGHIYLLCLDARMCIKTLKYSPDMFNHSVQDTSIKKLELINSFYIGEKHCSKNQKQFSLVKSHFITAHNGLIAVSQFSQGVSIYRNGYIVASDSCIPKKYQSDVLFAGANHVVMYKNYAGSIDDLMVAYSDAQHGLVIIKLDNNV